MKEILYTAKIASTEEGQNRLIIHSEEDMGELTPNLKQEIGRRRILHRFIHAICATPAVFVLLDGARRELQGDILGGAIEILAGVGYLAAQNLIRKDYEHKLDALSELADGVR